jgi:hypothetical protein
MLYYTYFYIGLSTLSSLVLSWENSSVVKGRVITWDHHPGKMLFVFLFSLGFAFLTVTSKIFEIDLYNIVNHILLMILYFILSFYIFYKQNSSWHHDYKESNLHIVSKCIMFQTYGILLFIGIEYIVLKAYKYFISWLKFNPIKKAGFPAFFCFINNLFYFN